MLDVNYYTYIIVNKKNKNNLFTKEILQRRLLTSVLLGWTGIRQDVSPIVSSVGLGIYFLSFERSDLD